MLWNFDVDVVSNQKRSTGGRARARIWLREVVVAVCSLATVTVPWLPYYALLCSSSSDGMLFLAVVFFLGSILEL